MQKISPFMLVMGLMVTWGTLAWAGGPFEEFNSQTAPFYEVFKQNLGSNNATVNNILSQANTGNVITGNVIGGSTASSTGGAGGSGGSGGSGSGGTVGVGGDGGTGGTAGNSGNAEVNGGLASNANVIATLGMSNSMSNISGVGQSGQVAGIMNNQMISVSVASGGR